MAAHATGQPAGMAAHATGQPAGTAACTTGRSVETAACTTGQPAEARHTSAAGTAFPRSAKRKGPESLMCVQGGGGLPTPSTTGGGPYPSARGNQPEVAERAVAGDRVVNLFRDLVKCSSVTAVSFLNMCDSLGAAVACYCFCPSMERQAGRPGSAWGLHKTVFTGIEIHSCHCSFCGMQFGDRSIRVRVRVLRRGVRCIEGKYLTLPRERAVLEEYDCPQVFCDVCWQYAATVRERTQNCPKTGGMSEAMMRNALFRHVADMSYTYAEAEIMRMAGEVLEHLGEKRPRGRR